MAVLKRQLLHILPGSTIFLDIDDLENINDLEMRIAQSGTILNFLSRGYFSSANCAIPIRIPRRAAVPHLAWT